jgi:cytochrome P450
MPLAHHVPSQRARLRRELPPSPPFPASLQTLACRRWPLTYFEACRKRFGSRFTGYTISMPPLVFLSDPQDIRAVVTASPAALHPGAGGAVIEPIVGPDSFMLREEGVHMNGRNAIMPAFHRKVMREHAEMVAELAEREIASWPLDTAFPLYPRLRALTLRVILKVLFGEEEGARMRALHGRVLDMLSVAASLVLQEPRLSRLPGWHGIWKRFVETRHEVDELIFALVERRRPGGGRREDVLELLLGAHNLDGSRLSNRQVRDQLVSLILAGHETTASQLAWAFQLLAHNPAVQERLAEELKDGGGEEYLTATVEEVLRHRPVFLFTIPRAVAEPVEIGGWTYHSPARLLGCIYLMHHDPALFPDPQEFRPERFIGAPPRTRTWLPWGGGRKRCPGQHLATLELRTVLRAAVSLWRVLPAAGSMEHALWRSVIVTPHEGSRVILRRRVVRRMQPSPRSQSAVA